MEVFRWSEQNRHLEGASTTILWIGRSEQAQGSPCLDIGWERLYRDANDPTTRSFSGRRHPKAEWNRPVGCANSFQISRMRPVGR